MATRKTSTKAPAAKAAKSTGKAESKPAAKPASKPAAKAETRTAAKPAAAPAKTSAAVVAGKASRSATPVATPVRTEAPARPAEPPTGEARYRWIAHAAYLRAERRGFAPGQEVDDWLSAEAEFVAVHGVG